MADYLVVGLGNIGAEYASTRHNMGFMILDAWAQASNVVFSVERYGAVAEVSFKGRHFTLLKPSTYMNLSGNAVRYWLQKLNLPLENLLVVSDDLNLPFGTLRMRLNGSAGGHNGLENIIWTLESEDWARIRVGIGNGFSRGGQIDYVLGALTPEEMELIPDIAGRVIQGIKDFSTIGPQRAMNFVNAKPKPPKPATESPEN
jgi:PTH1 family peptidyl-tRNA hydrolase